MKSNTGGCVVWLTGLSGAGKTTLAENACRYFKDHSKRVEHLDGDRIRKTFPTGFSHEERDEHILRVGRMASGLEQEGILVFASFISPYQMARDKVRQMCSRFIEVYVNTPLEECERRDDKGLYKKARLGEIKNFTGISDPYEPPVKPDVVISTVGCSPQESCDQLINSLLRIFELRKS